MTELDRISKLIKKAPLKRVELLDGVGDIVSYHMVNKKLTFLADSYNKVVEMTYEGSYIGGVIPKGKFVWDTHLLVVIRKANIHDHEKYINILENALKPSEVFAGYRFSIDGEIVERDISSRKVRGLTSYYLKARNDKDHQVNIDRVKEGLPSLYGYDTLTITSADGKSTQYTGDKFPNLKKLKV